MAEVRVLVTEGIARAVAEGWPVLWDEESGMLVVGDDPGLDDDGEGMVPEPPDDADGETKSLPVLKDKGGQWDESKHPRAADGKFGSGGGASSGGDAGKGDAKPEGKPDAKPDAKPESGPERGRPEHFAKPPADHAEALARLRSVPGTERFYGDRNKGIGYRNGCSDDFQSHLSKAFGADALPQVADDAEIDRLVAAGGIDGYRGLKDAKFCEDFRTGPMFLGGGNLYGNGTYTATVAKGASDEAMPAGKPAAHDQRTDRIDAPLGSRAQAAGLAARYATYGGAKGAALRVAVLPDARVGKYEEVVAGRDRMLGEMRKRIGAIMGTTFGLGLFASKQDKAEANRLKGLMPLLEGDIGIGRYALMMGYDAYTHDDLSQAVILNRGMCVAGEKDVFDAAKGDVQEVRKGIGLRTLKTAGDGDTMPGEAEDGRMFDPGESKRAGMAMASPYWDAPPEPAAPDLGELDEQAMAAIRRIEAGDGGIDDLPDGVRDMLGRHALAVSLWERRRDAKDAKRAELGDALRRLDREGGKLADLPEGLAKLFAEAEAAIPKEGES